MKYQKKRLRDRTVDELIGLSRGIIADKVVNQQEAEFLMKWMAANASYCEDKIVSQLYCRIQEMLIDGILDADEQKELLEILRMFTGEFTIQQPRSLPTALPFNNPLPEIEFPCMKFCLTGKFAYGPRKICEQVITERGGKVSSTIYTTVNYLVVGYFGSRHWSHTSYGRKIEQAAELRANKYKIAIIPEDHWATAAFRM